MNLLLLLWYWLWFLRKQFFNTNLTFLTLFIRFRTMCSVGDDFDDQEAAKYLPSNLKTLNLDSKCNKCRENKCCILLRHKDSYCKECFLSATTHKFKAFLGKSRYIHAGDKVLINYKEGHECAALIHMVRNGLDLATHKKLRFEPVIVYVERNFGLKNEERLDILNNIGKHGKLYGFKVYFVSLLSFIDDGESLASNLTQNYENLKIGVEDDWKIDEILRQQSSRTHKLEYLKTIERNLLYKIGDILNCKHIFYPDLGSHVASDLLTNISLGKGIHLPLDIGLCDNRNPNINVLRPMRHFDHKEITFYNYFNDVHPVSLPLKASSDVVCVQSLMKTFVNNLQVNFPATITTIVRTGDKMELDESLKENPRCVLCLGPVEHVSESLCSAESTMFSSLISNRKIIDSVTPEVAFEKVMENFKKSSAGDYCYSCSRINGVETKA